MRMEKKNDRLFARVSLGEKRAFLMAADLAGVSLATWLREGLRAKSQRELKAAGKTIPFRDSTSGSA